MDCPQGADRGVRVGKRDLGQDALAGQRGAQLVGDVGDELALGGEGGLEPAEQPVEGVRQLLELVVGAVQRQALVKVKGGNMPCGCRDRAQRAQHPARHHPAEPG
jgi:hypothetical protein